MKHIGLFEGVGGFSLAAKWMGWETVAWCEIKEECQQILRHHYPKAEGYGDIKKTDFKKYANRIDILTGGFPCQPYSTAGKRLGTGDDRHLWPEMLRAIRQIQPRWVVGENVRGLTNWNGGMVFDQVQADLEAEGYEVLPFLLPACAVNAPHRRDRIWFVAKNANSNGRDGIVRESKPGKREQRDVGAGNNEWIQAYHSEVGIAANTTGERYKERKQSRGWENEEKSRSKLVAEPERFSNIKIIANACGTRREKFNTPDFAAKSGYGSGAHDTQQSDWRKFPTQSPVCNGNDGFPRELLRQRIREDSMGYLSEKEINKILSKSATKWREESLMGMGNAIVPQLVLQIFKAIEQYEQTTS